MAVKPGTEGSLNLFAATGQNGLFSSSDYGQKWSKSSLARRSVTALCTTDQNLLAGSINGGLYSSSDNGLTWNALPFNLTFSIVSAIAQGQNSTGGSNLYAATSGSGIFRSTDNGRNWNAVNKGFLWPYIWSVIAADSLLFAAADSSGIYCSTNYGGQWFKADQGIGKVSAYSLACSHSKEGMLKVYAGGYGCIFISEDNGKNWIKRTMPRIGPELYSWTWTLCLLDTAGGQTDIFAGTESLGILRSTDDGITWDQVNNGLKNLCILDLKSYNGNLFAATASGVFLSTDRGISWKSVNNGLEAVYVKDLESAPGTAGEMNIFAATNGDGVFLSSDGGMSWTDVNQGLKDKQILSLLMTDSCLLAGTIGGAFKSYDKGLSWKRAAQDDWTLGAVSRLAKCNNKLFAATSRGLFSSEDYGNTWKKAGAELPSFEQFYALAVSGNSVWAGSSKGIFASFNGGLNWKSMSNGFPDLLVNSLFITHSETGRERIFAGTRMGVYVSEDNSQTWKQTGLNRPSTPFNCFAASGQNLIAASDSGVLVSKDGGSLWEEFNTGLDENYIYSIKVIGGYIYAGTFSGIFRRPLSDLPGANDSTSGPAAGFFLEQNYPNPFNPATTISYSLPKQAYVELKVFDMLGREIRTLVNKEQSEGNYKVPFEASHFPSGIYIYRLRAGGYSSSRRMILMK
ncbi:MAG TPA: T9SS type A sorting domain-containing protein [Ignavibacteriales bacterium]|nr:T9SS type A sorting domain-containing protein [Ignavibacteriales bacterium]